MKPIRGVELLATLEQAAGRAKRSGSSQGGSQEASTAAAAFVLPPVQRLAQAIVGGVSLKEDPRTFAHWAKVPGVTEDSLHRLCELLNLDGRTLLAFTRLLRAVTLVENHGVMLAESLDVSDPKTLARLLSKAGFADGRNPYTVTGFVARQTLLPHGALTRAVAALLPPSPSPQSAPAFSPGSSPSVSLAPSKRPGG